jgi:hypothetical protein
MNCVTHSEGWKLFHWKQWNETAAWMAFIASGGLMAADNVHNKTHKLSTIYNQ